MLLGKACGSTLIGSWALVGVRVHLLPFWRDHVWPLKGGRRNLNFQESEWYEEWRVILFEQSFISLVIRLVPNIRSDPMPSSKNFFTHPTSIQIQHHHSSVGHNNFSTQLSCCTSNFAEDLKSNKLDFYTKPNHTARIIYQIERSPKAHVQFAMCWFSSMTFSSPFS
jgi:hypothetical protein